MRFKLDKASLIVGSKFTILSLFYVVFGGLYLEGPFNGVFFALPVWEAYILEGLIHGGAYFQNFTVSLSGKYTDNMCLAPVRFLCQSAGD